VKPSEIDFKAPENGDEYSGCPDIDIPDNRLVQKLSKGLSMQIKRMKTRMQMYLTVRRIHTTKWIAPPRENATLTFVDNSAFLIGGLNQKIEADFAEVSLKNQSGSIF
jgi:uridine kinase